MSQIIGKVGMTPRGMYDRTRAYERLDVVTYQGSSWVAIVDVPAQISPAMGSDYWQLQARMGETGPQGPVGPQGNSAFDGTGVELVNNLTQGGQTAALSAEQGKILKQELTELESKVGTSEYNYSANVPFVLDKYFTKEDVIIFSPSQTNVKAVTLGGYIDGGGTEDIVIGALAGETKSIKLTKNYTKLYLFSAGNGSASLYLKDSIKGKVEDMEIQLQGVDADKGAILEGEKNTPTLFAATFYVGDVIMCENIGLYPATIGGYLESGATEDIFVNLPVGQSTTIKLTKNYTKLYGFSGQGAYKMYIKRSTKFEQDVKSQINDLYHLCKGVEVEAEKNVPSLINIPFYAGDVILYKNIGLYPATLGGYLESGGTEDIVIYLPAGESKSIKLTKNYTKLYGFSGQGAYKISVVRYSEVEKYIETQIESSPSANTFGNTSLNIGLSPFLKFASVGDSLSVGEWQEDGGSFVNRRDLQNSWGQILARKHGNKCLNFGFAGATCKSFYDSESHGISELLLSENLCQAYIIGLGTNDTSAIGSIADINWNDKSLNADSFYGNYAKVIQAIKEYAPKSLLFCLTIPSPRNDESKNTAIRNIIETCDIDGVYLVDLDTEKYRKLYSSAEVTGFYYNGHFNAGGYAVCGNILDMAIGEVIIEHNTDSAIRNISGIPYGNGEIVA